MYPEEELKPVVIFTGTFWQAGMVMSLLKNANIEAFLYDGARGTYNPGWNLPGEQGSVRVIVSLRACDQAKLIVEEYEKNLKSE
jgi:hypothetical protein